MTRSADSSLWATFVFVPWPTIRAGHEGFVDMAAGAMVCAMSSAAASIVASGWLRAVADIRAELDGRPLVTVGHEAIGDMTGVGSRLE